MQGFIEQYYEGLPLEYWKYWSPGKEFKEDHTNLLEYLENIKCN